ncbi:MAG: hypothetical protein RRY20_03940 [Bilophila sp.]
MLFSAFPFSSQEPGSVEPHESDCADRADAGTSDASKSAQTQEKHPSAALFGKHFTEKEQKSLFLYLMIGIVLMELAVTVGALVFSITNAQTSSRGVPQFHFPWIGYLVSVVMVPVLVMLLVNLVSLGFSRTTGGSAEPDPQTLEGIPQKMRTFYALVRGAPTVILFAGFVLMGAGVYYLDGLMVFLLKIGDSFQTIAIWVVGGFAAAWTISYAVRMWLQYKTKQLEAEYLFRQEVLRRTGMVILEAKHAPTTELRMLPPVLPAAPPALDIGQLDRGQSDTKEGQ